MFAEKCLQVIKDHVDKAYGGNVSQAAAYYGLSVHTLRRWLLGERTPTISELGKALDKIGVTVIEPNAEMDEYAMVPLVTARPGPDASLITENKVSGLYAFRKSILRRVGIDVSKAILMDVQGESMEPLIRDKDTILVDQSAKVLIDGHIFLVGFGKELLIKRVQRAVHGWRLRSENPAYTDVLVEGNDLQLLRVYGRVRWFGRIV